MPATHLEPIRAMDRQRLAMENENAHMHRLGLQRLPARAAARRGRVRDPRDEMGNRVSSWIDPMPLAEADPLVQLTAVTRRTDRLERSHQAIAIETRVVGSPSRPPDRRLRRNRIQIQLRFRNETEARDLPPCSVLLVLLLPPRSEQTGGTP